ncbi:hypothetical protein C1H46_019491 [Malus baccata]|uniref:Uncharacterized protein n=1 Tax=Malus baccata TaxID=106549 RepID=A0A540M8U0_MALBA|nr:hypothetical protein C1H46_019491 [Malus baccata]
MQKTEAERSLMSPQKFKYCIDTHQPKGFEIRGEEQKEASRNSGHLELSQTSKQLFYSSSSGRINKHNKYMCRFVPNKAEDHPPRETARGLISFKIKP